MKISMNRTLKKILRSLNKHRNSTEMQSTVQISGFSSNLIDEGLRAIPGGRYGCAQFVKTCGPVELKQCSLGKLSQMVQKAISDDILRYQKTLLVWVETIEKDSVLGLNTQEELNKKKIEVSQKLDIVKRALIDILSQTLEGVSLAQLPSYLKK